jgi:hypothetical protein
MNGEYTGIWNAAVIYCEVLPMHYSVKIEESNVIPIIVFPEY